MGVSQRLKNRFRKFLQRPGTTVDLAPLEHNPAVEFDYIQTNGVITAADLDGFDALILLMPRIEPESFPKDGRLAIVATSKPRVTGWLA